MIATLDEMDLLRHMIGIEHLDGRDLDLAGDPWRNHYAAAVGGDAERALLAMVDAGLVERGGTINEGESKLRYFRATSAGIQLVRTDERERRRAAGMRLWRVSYPDEGCLRFNTVLARSRGAAKWEIISALLEVGADRAWCFKNVRGVAA